LASLAGRRRAFTGKGGQTAPTDPSSIAHAVTVCSNPDGGGVYTPGSFGIGADPGHHEHRSPSTRVTTEANGSRSMARRSIARLVPQPEQNTSSQGVSASSAARIVGDHSMTRPVASRRFQRSTRAPPRGARPGSPSVGGAGRRGAPTSAVRKRMEITEAGWRRSRREASGRVDVDPLGKCRPGWALGAGSSP
jgi:hypothetical protein